MSRILINWLRGWSFELGYRWAFYHAELIMRGEDWKFVGQAKVFAERMKELGKLP